MKRSMICVLCVVLMNSAVAFAQDQRAEPQAPTPVIDLVICLDTSSSMNGLIDSAKTRLWAIVNELATAKPTPRLRVALYHFGNTRLDSNTGWVEQISPLTDDLDTIYGKLFALTTSGGQEYVARVIRAATTELDWTRDKDALKMIIVAGNEPATQDPQFKLEDICRSAISKGIVINTIYCGDEAAGRNSGWADAARWADGRYAAIDQNAGTITIATPFDDQLTSLGAALNTTYIAYGQFAGEGLGRQVAQDANAASIAPAAAAERAVAKSSALYQNARWDLVDAEKQGQVKLEALKDEELPDAMRGMTPEQRTAYVQQQAQKRAEIQKQIHELNRKREAYIKQEQEKKGLDTHTSFDVALRQTIREQAGRKGIIFEAP